MIVITIMIKKIVCASRYYLNNVLPELNIIYERDYSTNSFKRFANFSPVLGFERVLVITMFY